MAYTGDTITIKGVHYPRPKDFAPTREDVYAAEYTTMSGSYRADRVGWKFSDIELKWDALPHSQVLELTKLSGTYQFTFDDPTGFNYEQVRRISAVSMRHRYQINGVTYWKNVSVKFSFLDTHTD